MQVKQISSFEDLKEAFKLTLNNSNKELYTMLFNRPLVYFFDEEFYNFYMQERVNKNIFLKSLRFRDEEVDNKDHKNYDSLYKEVRVTPREISIYSSIILWDNNIIMFDEDTIEGVFIKDNENMSKTMKSLFENIWSESKQNLNEFRV